MPSGGIRDCRITALTIDRSTLPPFTCPILQVKEVRNPWMNKCVNLLTYIVGGKRCRISTALQSAHTNPTWITDNDKEFTPNWVEADRTYLKWRGQDHHWPLLLRLKIEQWAVTWSFSEVLQYSYPSMYVQFGPLDWLLSPETPLKDLHETPPSSGSRSADVWLALYK